MPSDASLEAVKRLGNDLLASRSHINNAPLLLSILSSSVSSSLVASSTSSSPECLLEALFSLQAFFVPLLRSGELSRLVSKKAKEKLQGQVGTRIGNGEKSGDGTPVEAEAIYKSWLWDKYNEFLEILLKIISQPETSPSVQAAGLDALMEFSRQERQGEFSNRIYGKLCSMLVRSKGFSSNVLGLLVAKYFKYFDICYYTCANLEKLATMCHGREYKDYEMISDDDHHHTSEISVHSLMCNIYDLLSHLNYPKEREKDSVTALENWGRPPGTRDDPKVGQFKDEDQAVEKAVREKSSEKRKLSRKDVKKLKSKMSRAWLTFLRLRLSPLIYKKVLAQLHKTVIPFLTNPILLSDFLTNSYNQGGVISVMALNGLFVLITQYGLEYPDFYNKLYALLEPSIFVAKHRARFFELLDMCLKSPHLPSYLAAAFAKKLGRMALISPPAGALIVIAIVHNLLRRHPSINCLVHRDCAGSESPISEPSEGEHGQEPNDSDVGERRAFQEAEERLGVDPFIASENDTAKCNALKSSLWEVETLRRHYCPAVSRFVASLETDLTVRARTTELAIKDFSSGSYATIFAEEVGRRMKQVPLAFYNSIPTTLFPKNSVGREMSGEVDFPGWSFGGVVGLQNGEQDDMNMTSNVSQEEVDKGATHTGGFIGGEGHDAGKELEDVKCRNGENFKEFKVHSPCKKRKKRG